EAFVNKVEGFEHELMFFAIVVDQNYSIAAERTSSACRAIVHDQLMNLLLCHIRKPHCKSIGLNEVPTGICRVELFHLLWQIWMIMQPAEHRALRTERFNYSP